MRRATPWTAALLTAAGCLLAVPGASAAGTPTPTPTVTPAATSAPGVTSTATPTVTPAVTPTPTPTPTRPPSPTTSTCVAANGTVSGVTSTSITFALPGSTCVPQAIFFVSLFTSEAAAGANAPVAASGTGSRQSGSVVVTGLSPGTAYWYRFQGPGPAPVAGPVTTLPLSSPSPSTGGTPTATTEPPAPACSAAFEVRGRWPGGYLAEVRVTAGAGAIDGWTVTWPGGSQPVTHVWSARLARTADPLTATNLSWNGVLPAGRSVTFGLIGATSGSGSSPVTSPALTCTPGEDSGYEDSGYRARGARG